MAGCDSRVLKDFLKKHLYSVVLYCIAAIVILCLFISSVVFNIFAVAGEMSIDALLDKENIYTAVVIIILGVGVALTWKKY